MSGRKQTNAETREINNLNIFANNLNKLKRKVEAQVDPYTDMLEAIEIIRMSATNQINELMDERSALKEKIKELQEKIRDLNAKLKKESEEP